MTVKRSLSLLFKKQSLIDMTFFGVKRAALHLVILSELQ